MEKILKLQRNFIPKFNALKNFNILGKNFSTSTKDKEYLEPPKFTTNLSSDIVTAKKQIFWRIRNLGQLELEYVVFKWYNAHADKLTNEELKEFSVEVLEMENPDLNKYLVNFKEADKSLKYTNLIQDYCK